MSFKKKKSYEPPPINTPKFTHEELEKMPTEKLKWLYLNLLGEIRTTYKIVDDRHIWTDDMYGCETWGEVRKLADEIKKIYDKRTGKKVYKIKVNKDKNKVLCYYVGYKTETIEEMIDGKGSKR